MTGAMDASQIKALRAVIAASCEEGASRTGRGVFARLFAPKDAVRGASDSPQPPHNAAPFPHQDENAAAAALDIAADPSEGPMVQTLLILGLGPRRAAFGQRREQVMALVDVGPARTCVLRLTAPDGAALDDIGGRGADNPLATAARQPYQAAGGGSAVLPRGSRGFAPSRSDTPRPGGRGRAASG
jgi:hypothetical protein